MTLIYNRLILRHLDDEDPLFMEIYNETYKKYKKYVGISKKMWDKYERRRLKKIANKIKEKNVGVIIRTVAEGKSEDQINNDYKSLIKKWKQVEAKVKSAKTPALVYEDLETASSRYCFFHYSCTFYHLWWRTIYE